MRARSTPYHARIGRYNSSLMKWRRWFLTALTILAWIVLGGILVWLLGHVSQAVVVLVLGAIIATVIAPLITWLEHLIPRTLAIALIYLLIFAGLAILLYVLANIILDQMTSLIGYIQSVMDGRRNDPLFEMLKRFGFSLNQFQSFRQQIIAQLQNVVNNLFPVLSNFFTLILNTLLLALVSFYFLLSSPRITHWLRNETPRAVRQDIRFLLDTLQQVIGGNFRGLLLLATLISALTRDWLILFRSSLSIFARCHHVPSGVHSLCWLLYHCHCHPPACLNTRMDNRLAGVRFCRDSSVSRGRDPRTTYHWKISWNQSDCCYCCTPRWRSTLWDHRGIPGCPYCRCISSNTCSLLGSMEALSP